MKENKKKNVLSGAIGAAAGVAGAVGASELNDWLKENDENEELDDELDDAIAANVPDHDDEEDVEDDIVDTPIAQNPDSDEIMPVDSGGMGQIIDGNEVAMIDVDPNEIAQEIISDPMDDENLMASHDGTEIAPDGDIDALFDEEETDPVVDDEDLAGTEFEEEGEFDELDDEVDDNFADADADEDVMDDMVDDIG